MQIIIISLIISIILSDFLNSIILYFNQYFLKLDKLQNGEELKINIKESFEKIYNNSLIFGDKSFCKDSNKQKIISLLFVFLTIFGLTFLTISSFAFSLKSLIILIFIYCLIILTFVDIRTQYLPDTITIPLIFWGVIQSLFGITTNFKLSIIGAILGFGIFWTINFIFKLIRNKEGMGGGDFKLLAAIGAWLGVVYLPIVIFLSAFLSILGAIITAPLIGRKINQPLPFGPYLAISAIICIFYGDVIISHYLNFIN